MSDSLIEPRGDAWYYIGPLGAGIWLVLSDPEVHEWLDLKQVSPDVWEIQTGQAWGRGPTPEVAWRFALGETFGPDDSEYSEVRLHAALADAVAGHLFD